MCARVVTSCWKTDLQCQSSYNESWCLDCQTENRTKGLGTVIPEDFMKHLKSSRAQKQKAHFCANPGPLQWRSGEGPQRRQPKEWQQQRQSTQQAEHLEEFLLFFLLWPFWKQPHHDPMNFSWRIRMNSQKDFFHLNYYLTLDSYPNSWSLNLQPYMLYYQMTFVSKQFFWDNNSVLIHLWSFAVFAKSSLAIALCLYKHCVFPNAPS